MVLTTGCKTMSGHHNSHSIIIHCIYTVSRAFPSGGPELLHAIDNAFENLKAVGIADIDPEDNYAFSLWGITADREFDRSWPLEEDGNQLEWLQTADTGLNVFTKRETSF